MKKRIIALLQSACLFIASSMFVHGTEYYGGCYTISFTTNHCGEVEDQFPWPENDCLRIFCDPGVATSCWDSQWQGGNRCDEVDVEVTVTYTQYSVASGGTYCDEELYSWTDSGGFCTRATVSGTWCNIQG